MDIEKLIEEVRKYSVLYDQTNGQYKNTEYKERVWTAIAKELKATGGVDICKKKWSSVRDHFRRIINKRKTASGQAPVNHRKYKFENHLEFLLPHITERETISNIPFTEDNQTDDDETDSMIDESQHGNITEERQTETASKTNEIESVDDDAQHSQSSLAGSSIGVTKKNKFAKPAVVKPKIRHPEKLQESPSATSQLMEYILSEKRAENKRKEQATEELPKHPVDAFLTGIAPSLKSLSPLLFHAAKGSIFALVQEFELKQLMGNQNVLIDHGRAGKRPAFSPASTSSRTDLTPYPSPVEDERRTTPSYQQLASYQPAEQINSAQTDTFADHFSNGNTNFF